MSIQFQKEFDRLTELFQLQDNWNNEGSPAPNTESIATAKAILELYQEYCKVKDVLGLKVYTFPLVDGGIQLVFCKLENEIEIEIYNQYPYELHVWHCHDESETCDEKILPLNKYRDESFASDIRWLLE